MSQTITAIYEDGVLMPQSPVGLAEHEQVQVTINPVPLYLLPPEERVKVLEKFWREIRPVDSGGIPYLTRDELHDRS